MKQLVILTKSDLETLNLSEKESVELDEKLHTLISKSKDSKDGSCCKTCECSGYMQGNPSTVCGNCGHDWNVHKC